jgi:WD40 repeat protein
MSETRYDSAVFQQLVNEGRRQEALKILIDFSLWMYSLRRQNDPSTLEQWCDGWDLLAPTDQELGLEGRMWRDFLRMNRHRFRLAKNQPWRVFFQAALDHADDSAVTRAAESWHSNGLCEWSWLKWKNRPKTWREDLCVAVLVDGNALSYDVHVRVDDKIVSIPSAKKKKRLLSSEDHDPHIVRVWSRSTGQFLGALDVAIPSVDAAPVGSGPVHYWSEHCDQPNDHRVRLWNISDMALVHELIGHTGTIRGVYALNESRVITWSNDGSIRIWYIGPQSNLSRGRRPKRLRLSVVHKGIDDLFFLADRLIMSLSISRLTVWELDTGRAVCQFDGERKLDYFTGAHPISDACVVVWGRNGCLFLFQPQTGMVLSQLSGHTGNVIGSMVLAEGRLISWSSDHTLRVWDMATGECIEVLVGHTAPVIDVVELSDGRVVSYSRDDSPRIWDLNREKNSEPYVARNSSVERPRQPAHADRPTSAECSDRPESGDRESHRPPQENSSGRQYRRRTHANERRGMLSGIDSWEQGRGSQLQWNDLRNKVTPRTSATVQWLRLAWKRISGGARNRPLAGHKGAIKGLVALEDDRIVSWSDDGTVRLWDASSGVCVATVARHHDSVLGIHLCSNQRLLSWSQDGTVRLSTMKGDSSILLDGHILPVMGAEMIDDERVLSWSLDGTLRIWNVRHAIAGEQAEKAADTVDSRIMGACVLDRRRMVSWFKDGTLRIYDMAMGTEVLVLKGHTGSVTHTEVLEGNRLLSWSEDKTVRLWDSGTGDALTVMGGHARPLSGVSFIGDDRAVSWSDDSLRLWDPTTGRSIAALKGQPGAIWHVEVLANHQILSCSKPTRMRRGLRRKWSREQDSMTLWDSRTGKRVGKWPVDCHRYTRIGDSILLVWDHCLDGAILFGWNAGRDPVHLDGIDESDVGIYNAALLPKSARLVMWVAGSSDIYAEPLLLKSWSLDEGKLLRVHKGHTAAICGASELDDGCVVSWSTDGEIRIWGTAALGSTCFEGAGNVEGVKDIGGGLLLSWSNDHVIRIWDRTGRALVGTLTGHCTRICLVDRIDEGRIFSVSADGLTIMWDTHKRACIEKYNSIDELKVLGIIKADRMSQQKTGSRVVFMRYLDILEFDRIRSSALSSLARGHSHGGFDEVHNADSRVFYRDRHLRFCQVVSP